MITAGFSESELIEEIKEDVKNALVISDAKDKKVKRIILKASSFPVYVHSIITTPLKNKWLILWAANTKKNIGDNSIITFVCIHETAHGRYAYMPTWIEGVMILIVYPPHFFRRFRERMHLNISGTDLLIRFFRYNADYAFETKTIIEGDKYGMRTFGSCKEGVAMGLRSINNIVLFKTFVPLDMLKGEQIEKASIGEVLRQEMHEKTGLFK